MNGTSEVSVDKAVAELELDKMLRNRLLRIAIPRVPVEGTIFHDGHGHVFLNGANGPTLMLEIRGHGAGLPQEAIADHVVKLWNLRQKAE